MTYVCLYPGNTHDTAQIQRLIYHNMREYNVIYMYNMQRTLQIIKTYCQVLELMDGTRACAYLSTAPGVMNIGTLRFFSEQHLRNR